MYDTNKHLCKVLWELRKGRNVFGEIQKFVKETKTKQDIDSSFQSRRRMVFQAKGTVHTKAQRTEKVWQAEKMVRADGHGFYKGFPRAGISKLFFFLSRVRKEIP